MKIKLIPKCNIGSKFNKKYPIKLRNGVTMMLDKDQIAGRKPVKGDYYLNGDKVLVRKKDIDKYVEDMIKSKNGSKIHIKKENVGKFTEYCGGKVTEECIQKGKNSPNPKIRKRATFADNARHFKH